jgi:DNA-binding NarL/FixJ family response regulator
VGVTLATILIVDDSSSVRKVVRTLFEAEKGFTISGEAVNGLDAIAKTEELQPDLIVLDLSMPIMNGLEAADVLKSRWPEIPIYILTAHGGPEVDRAAQTAGIDAVFAKDKDMPRLIANARAAFPGKSKSSKSAKSAKSGKRSKTTKTSRSPKPNSATKPPKRG